MSAVLFAPLAPIFLPSPINPAWILAGDPQAELAELGYNADGSLWTCQWTCTAGTFNWHYDRDELVTILQGEVIVNDLLDTNYTALQAGDSVIFPAGSSARWRVPSYVRKYAVFHTPRSTLRRFLSRVKRAL